MIIESNRGTNPRNIIFYPPSYHPSLLPTTGKFCSPECHCSTSSTIVHSLFCVNIHVVISVQMCVLVYASSGLIKKLFGALLVGAFVATFAASALGYISPYSVDDANYPMPKRFFLQVGIECQLLAVQVGCLLSLTSDPGTLILLFSPRRFITVLK